MPLDMFDRHTGIQFEIPPHLDREVHTLPTYNPFAPFLFPSRIATEMLLFGTLVVVVATARLITLATQLPRPHHQGP